MPDSYLNLLKILKEDYGIETAADLKKAVERMGAIDVTLFSTKI